MVTAALSVVALNGAAAAAKKVWRECSQSLLVHKYSYKSAARAAYGEQGEELLGRVWEFFTLLPKDRPGCGSRGFSDLWA